MQKDIDNWLKKIGEITLRGIGIKEGQTVLDFGCGKGFYSIPIAQIVGSLGNVYALDRDAESIEKLKQRANSLGMKNIIPIKTSGEIQIPINTDSVDVVLLYDIFWYFPATDPRLYELLEEVCRILKPGGFLSVYPKHVNSGDIQRIIEKSDFCLKDTYHGLLIHDKNIIRDEAFNYKMD